ncbi:hypothetical protein [Deinococcus gobiensis]|uniref:Uncharacterized protein n=1 Tax=Deinococcus gobiensis (strain DSM 21396 / JCM 16679 / CGMCC 1.7299 / I-0) TaxID=745776 RepID=H8H3V8_DEIGI|nr:hypothetical protein [Deinococcus gobiensis]AFD28205.1 hypothetical protein DGo_PE0061 [Deinococcus gobiensis I-0]
MSASIFPEPECRCGRLLDDVGRCGHCDQQPVRISACTGDLKALLQRPGYERGDVAYVIATPEGEVTLRTVADAVRLDIDRFGGALAGLVISETVLLDLVTDLMLCLRHGAQGLWAEGQQLLTLPDGTVLLSEQASGVRLTVDRQGGAVAWVTLDEPATRELVTELMLSLRRQHWGAA